ncbi:hypothetical protein KQH82_02340 [bacterium]|nr:hypothetical protein [bacterium]
MPQSSVSIPIEADVQIAGSKLSVEIEEIDIKQHVDSHHDCSVRVRLGLLATDDEFADVSRMTGWLGQELSLTIQPAGGRGPDQEHLKFVGILVNVETINDIDGTNQLVFHASSPTIAADGARIIRDFKNMSPDKAAQNTMRSYKITVGSCDSFGKSEDSILQYEETDFEFIKRMTSSNGAFSFYDGEEFRIIKKPLGADVDLTFREDLASFSVALGTAPMRYEAGTYDYLQSKPFQAKQDKGSGSPSGEFGKSIRASGDMFPQQHGFLLKASHATDQSSLSTSVKGAVDRSIGRMVKCTGVSSRLGVKLGHSIRVSSAGIYNGVYMVMAVRHKLEAGGYSNEFECVPVDMAYPTLISKRAFMDFLVVGRVTDVEDPEQLGRVQVKFQWLGEKIAPIWARLAVPHAGPERGWMTLPEIDDEVIVGFDRGNPAHPVILGFLYHSAAKPPAESTAKPPEVRVFTTKGGNKILFSDEQGGENILITTKDGANSLLLTMDGPKINVESKGDIKIKGKTITLEADNNIEVKAGGDFKVDAKMNLQTKAGVNYQAEGAMVKIKGNIINLN